MSFHRTLATFTFCEWHSTQQLPVEVLGLQTKSSARGWMKRSRTARWAMCDVWTVPITWTKVPNLRLAFALGAGYTSVSQTRSIAEAYDSYAITLLEWYTGQCFKFIIVFVCFWYPTTLIFKLCLTTKGLVESVALWRGSLATMLDWTSSSRGSPYPCGKLKMTSP